MRMLGISRSESKQLTWWVCSQGCLLLSHPSKAASTMEGMTPHGLAAVFRVQYSTLPTPMWVTLSLQQMFSLGALLLFLGLPRNVY